MSPLFRIAAESLGIPMVKPYLGIKNGVLEDSAAKDGANFAVIGATALEVSYFEERDVHNVATNYSLTVQMNWFKELLSALCNSSESKFLLFFYHFPMHLQEQNDFHFLSKINY